MHRKRYKAVLEEVVHELARDAISKLLVDETENNFQREDDDLVALPARLCRIPYLLGGLLSYHTGVPSHLVENHIFNHLGQRHPTRVMYV